MTGGIARVRQFLTSKTGRRAGIAAGVLVAAAGVGYLVDLSLSSGQLPRGTQVAGIDVGGQDRAAARARLEPVLDQRVAQPLTVRTGDTTTTVTPRTAGIGVDWDGTWERVGGQPVNPFTRLASFFTTRRVEPAATVDTAAMDRQLEALRANDRRPVEGGIAFEGAKPVAVRPVPGLTLDAAAARTVLTENWSDGSTLELPMVQTPAKVNADSVNRTLQLVAEPAVRAPITFTGQGGDATVEPEQIASALSFHPDGQGGLALSINHDALIAVLAPQLQATETQPQDASFDLTGTRASVRPAVAGLLVDWEKTLEGLPAVLTSPGMRVEPVAYKEVQPKLSTEDAGKLGITEVVGSFTTGGFSGPSGVNIGVVARKVNGALVRPGETFSLNGFTGTRGLAEGYVESGIINNGRPANAVGGGISQFATTLYNAAYFAGLEDAGHTEHSYYISRYPAAREATVFDGAIDLKFRNNTPYGVVIDASADNSNVTVRMWSTKTVEVESITGDRSKYTDPQTITLPAGRDCVPSSGGTGFTASDTRVIRDAKSGKEISRNTRTVKYDPIPVVRCQ
ncbi:VanW family protein [Nocardia tengchongensis]|uniref:VanW family protein n=1 Tax=Nocardia tengchongensis TaxID=2055889 RepID=UPI003611C65F